MIRNNLFMISDMYPILTRYGPFFLYSYTAVAILGIVLSLGLTKWLYRDQLPDNWVDGVLVGLLSGLLGGRIGFIWLEWDYFAQHTAEIFRLWQGGFSYLGVMFGILLGMGLWCRRQQRPLLPFLTLFAPAFALLSFAGWLACWLEGCAYGQTTTLSPFAADLPDTFGVFELRYRTQLMGMGLSLCVLGLVLWMRRRVTAVTLFALTLFLLTLTHLLITPLRGDPTIMLANWRLDSLLNASIAIITLIAFLLLQYQTTTNE